MSCCFVDLKNANYVCRAAQYLAVDDGWGAVQALRVERLQEWISHGGKNLRFVFVSACHSRAIGQAFVDAGVPHVVCCRHSNLAILSAAAVQFEKSFYRALASGRMLQESFELARQEVSVSPHLTLQERHAEMDKFCLLPKMDSANPTVNHNVPIFFTEPVFLPARRDPSQRILANDIVLDFPRPPEVFVGRDLDMFKILQHVKKLRLVRVCGRSGIGKSAVVKASCQYISDRVDVSGLEDILWVPREREGQSRNQHPLMDNFGTLFDRIQDDETPLRGFRKECQSCITEILKYLQDRKSLLVIQAKNLLPQGRLKLSRFLRDIMQNTSYVKVIVIHRLGDAGEIIHPRMECVQAEVRVENLDIPSTVMLFARMCPHVVDQTCSFIADAGALMGLLIPRQPTARPSRRLLTIFEALGMGIPEQVHRVAKNMEAKDYKKLIDIGRQKELNLKFQSRAAILKHIEDIQAAQHKAVEDRDFLYAHELQGRYNEVEELLQHFPDLLTVQRNVDLVRREIDVAITSKDWLHAQDRQSELSRLEKVAQVEKDALIAFGILDSVEEDDNEIFTTRACLDAKIDELERELQQVAERNLFKKAREIDMELRRLGELQPSRPSKQKWEQTVVALEAELAKAKTDREWDKAEFAFIRLSEAKSKLALEKEAEETLGQQGTSGEDGVSAILPPEPGEGTTLEGHIGVGTVTGSERLALLSTESTDRLGKLRTTRPASSEGDVAPGAVAIPGITQLSSLTKTSQDMEISTDTATGIAYPSHDVSDERDDTSTAVAFSSHASLDDIVLSGLGSLDEEAEGRTTGISAGDLFQDAPEIPSPKQARKLPPRTEAEAAKTRRTDPAKHNHGLPGRLKAPQPDHDPQPVIESKRPYNKALDAVYVPAARVDGADEPSEEPDRSPAIQSRRPDNKAQDSTPVARVDDSDEASAASTTTVTNAIADKMSKFKAQRLARFGKTSAASTSGANSAPVPVAPTMARLHDSSPRRFGHASTLAETSASTVRSAPNGLAVSAYPIEAVTARARSDSSILSVPIRLATNASQFNEAGPALEGTLHATAIESDSLRIQSIVQQTIRALSVSAGSVEKVVEPESVVHRLFRQRRKTKKS
jgi:hypothetical protein